MADRSGGIGLFGALFVLFLALKLCSVIDWSWWWVFAPLWGPPAGILTAMLGVLAAMGLASLLAGLCYLAARAFGRRPA